MFRKEKALPKRTTLVSRVPEDPFEFTRQGLAIGPGWRREMVEVIDDDKWGEWGDGEWKRNGFSWSPPTDPNVDPVLHL